MWKFRWLVILHLLLCSVALAVAKGSKNNIIWHTLDGKPPLVIARGGLSGVFPDSSDIAYKLALFFSLPSVILWCDVQLTKDGAGVCLPDLRLNNGTNVEWILGDPPNATYLVDGVATKGWFTVDFTLNDLSSNFRLTQGVYSRPPVFDNEFPIQTVEDVAQFKSPKSPKSFKPHGLWLNIQHDVFFKQHNLSMTSFIISVSRRVNVKYISSPEVEFLRSIRTKFKPSKMKLVFRFLGEHDVEPSINQTYGSLLKNLAFLKKFADGILVPKSYIWPVDPSFYLLPHTSLVLDAHKEGLQVFASDFANDAPYAYNFNYDPVTEYLTFIDNGNFSVDGVLSDSPITPSEAIDCFSHMGKDGLDEINVVVISHEGASGVYPGCTDLAYQTATLDGADVLDCPVQMTKDGVPICLGSINLISRTTVAQSDFSNLTRTIPELGGGKGIFTFDLTWEQIQNLKPEIFNPAPEYTLYPNPKHKNDGNFTSLSMFLQGSPRSRRSTNSVSGILISIKNAAYLAEKQGLNITGAVLDSLNEAGYNNQTAMKVMVQSPDSSVLIKFKKNSNYECVYEINEDIRDAQNSTILNIKKFADSVVINKASVYPVNTQYITGDTRIVSKLQAFNLSVYVQLFRNEFVYQEWDFFSDVYVETNTFVMGAGVNGVITDFPQTASKYKRNRCLGLRKKPSYMSAVEPTDLLQSAESMPPALPPNPVLSDSDVIEPPLPPVRVQPQAPNPGSPPPGHGSSKNGQLKVAVCIFPCNVAFLLATLAILRP